MVDKEEVKFHENSDSEVEEQISEIEMTDRNFENVHQHLNSVLSLVNIDILSGDHCLDVTSILLDLTFYNNPTLVDSAFQLLNKLYSQKTLLFQSLQNLQIIEEVKDLEVYQNLITLSVQCGELVEKSEHWLCEEGTKADRQALKMIDDLNRLCTYIFADQNMRSTFLANDDD